MARPTGDCAAIDLDCEFKGVKSLVYEFRFPLFCLQAVFVCNLLPQLA